MTRHSRYRHDKTEGGWLSIVAGGGECTLHGVTAEQLVDLADQILTAAAELDQPADTFPPLPDPLPALEALPF